MVAYCGMAYDVADGLTRTEAIARLGRLAASRKRTGHVVTFEPPFTDAEFGEPEDCALIPDTAGTAHVVEEQVPAWQCDVCGCLVKVGEPCCEQDRV
jgi:hypothetical protein